MKLGNSKEAYQIVERLFGDEWLDMMENKYSNIAEKMKNHITDYDYDVGKNSIDSLFDLDDLNLYNESIFQRIKRFFSGDDYSYKVDGIDDITEQLNNNVTEKLDTVNQQSLNNIDETVSNNESLLDKIKSIFKKQNEHQYIEVSTKQEVLNKVCDPIDDYANLDTTVTWFFQNDGFNSSNPYEIYVSAVGQGSKKQIPSFSSINEFYKRFNFDNGYYVQSQGNYFTHVFSDQTIYDSVGSITDRLYINANYDDAFMFAQLFADKCEKKGIPFYFKTANFSDINNVPDLSLLRDESIVIYAAEDHLADYVNICNEIKQQNPNLEFYQPPVFTGTIDGFIGYGGESRDHSISYNKKRSNVMTNAIKNATEDYKSVYPYFDLNTIKSNPTDYYNYLHRIFEYAKIYSQYVGIDINNFSFSVD